jgi:transcriptional regulator with XRE-family HTH domain
MEFHEKLQELRKQRGLTQEELAAALYVSRTAISKWESGRGYPNLDSLKALAQFYSVTVDELLSGDELLSLAREDNRQTRLYLCDLVFGLLDCSVSLLFFLPLFGQQTQNMLQECSLLTLTAISPYLKTIYFVYAIATVIVGLLLLSLQTFRQPFWVTCKHRLSVILSVIGTLLFIVSTQPYVAALLFFFLLIKIFMLIKRR